MFCLCELRVRIRCVDGRSRYLYAVLCGYLRILESLSVQSWCTLSISASYRVFVYGRYRKSRLVCVLLWNSDMSRHPPPLSGVAPAIHRVRMTVFPKNGKSGPIAGGGKFRHHLHSRFPKPNSKSLYSKVGVYHCVMVTIIGVAFIRMAIIILETAWHPMPLLVTVLLR